MEEVSKKQFKENREFLNKQKFFEGMTDSQKDAIASNLIVQHYKPGDVITSEGDQASSYYLIKSGTADCVKDGKVVRTLAAGDSFGEQALYTDGVRSLTVQCGKQECYCLGLSRKALQEVLGAQIQTVIQGNWSRWALDKNNVFSKLTKLQHEKWIMNAVVKKVPSGTVLAKAGDTPKEVYIVINGELAYGNQKFIKGTVCDDKLVHPSGALKTKYSPD